MKRKIILAIGAVVLIISSSFVGAVNVDKKIDQNSSIKIPLTDEDFSRIDEFVDSIEDEELKKKVENILDQIITDEGEVDIKAVEKISQSYYNIVCNKIAASENDFSEIVCSKCDCEEFNESLWPPEAFNLGTSTVFNAPYSGCFSWGDGTPGIDEYAHGCNRYSGGIGAYANAWIGGATAEGMQQLNFYVGRTKPVSIDAEVVRTGGKTTFGFGAFAGTEKTWSWDDFQINYHRSDVDPWWSWDIIILKIISLVTLLVGFTPGNLAEAISLLSTIVDFDLLAMELQDMLDDGDAEILHIKFSFTPNPGWHTIWVGLRATASACITGTGSAVTMGQVSKIKIDGIATPESPTISGPSSGKVDVFYEFCAKSNDPNGDEIRYYFDWGDNTNSDWTDYKASGTNVCKSHTYTSKGTYTIRVIVEDIDKMQSEATYTISIQDRNRPKQLLINNPLFMWLFRNFQFLRFLILN